MRKDIIIRPETHKDYKDIISLILCFFREGTDYSDGIDVVALVEEIRDSKYYIPELSFVAELNGKTDIMGYVMLLQGIQLQSLKVPVLENRERTKDVAMESENKYN